MQQMVLFTAADKFSNIAEVAMCKIKAKCPSVIHILKSDLISIKKMSYYNCMWEQKLATSSFQSL
jgi:hypothetical protein